MAKYIFKPKLIPHGWMWNYNHKIADRFATMALNDVNNFLSKPEIQSYIKENRWDDIFHEWDANPIFECGTLAFFLDLINVNFMDYLENPEYWFDNESFEEV